MKYLLLILFLGGATIVNAQDFAQHLTNARTAYSGTKLEEARFSMQKMMYELDLIMGKEVLALLPTKLDSLVAVSSKDEITAPNVLQGILINRTYKRANGKDTSGVAAEIEISTLSILPEVQKMSMALASFVGNDQEVRIKGYKASVQKVETEFQTTEYEVHVPVGRGNLVVKAPKYSREKVIALANALPIEEIAKKMQ